MIEPVAIRLDFWHWQSEVIPFKIISCGFSVFINELDFDFQSV